MSNHNPQLFKTAGIVILLLLLILALTTVLFIKTSNRPTDHPIAEALKPYDPTLPTRLSISTVTSKTPKPRNVCETPECITLAHQLHNYRDPSVDPCDNFYKATCGRYIEQSVVKGSRLSKKNQIFNQLIEEFLLKNETSSSKSENVIRLFYNKCVENKNLQETAEEDGKKYTEVAEVIKGMGSWPILDQNFIESEFDLNDMLSKIAALGINQFGFFGIEANLDQKFSILPFDSFVRMQEKFALYVFERNKGHIDNKTFYEDWSNVVKFEEELAEFEVTAGKTVEFSELKKAVPSIDFERIMKSYMRPNERDQMWDKIKSTVVTYETPVFFNKPKNIHSVLKNTPNRTIANYLMFSTFLTFFRKQKIDCFEGVIKNLPLAVLRVFVRNHFNKKNLNDASEMVNEFEESIVDIFQSSSWLHEETKKNAIRKVKMMKHSIGYPKEMEEPGALDKIYESLDISSTDSYFKILQKVDQFQMEQSIYYLAGKNKILETFYLLLANAFYIPKLNSLIVNVAIMDDPFLDSSYPKYAKIAGVGMYIGHEMGHGFDPDGRKRDEDGEWRDWWTPEDSTEYEKREKCYEGAYNNYDDPSFGKTLNGSITIHEIIADVMGQNIAWKTYKSLDMSNEPKIIGFEDYDLDKLYFQISALTWCSPREKTPLADQLKMMHPTDSFRINGIFSNMKQFAETFNCPVGSPMNPEEKCELF